MTAWRFICGDSSLGIGRHLPTPARSSHMKKDPLWPAGHLPHKGGEDSRRSPCLKPISPREGRAIASETKAPSQPTESSRSSRRGLRTPTRARGLTRRSAVLQLRQGASRESSPPLWGRWPAGQRGAFAISDRSTLRKETDGTLLTVHHDQNIAEADQG